MLSELRQSTCYLLVSSLGLLPACSDQQPLDGGTTNSSSTGASGEMGGSAGTGGIGGSAGAGSGGSAGAGGGQNAVASLLVQVVDTENNPIPTAIVTTNDGVLHPTDGAGNIFFENLTPGRFSARVERYGFATASVVVNLPNGAHSGIVAHLIPLAEKIPFDATVGATLVQGPVRVTVPADAMVNQYGERVSGAVEATIVPFDPYSGLAAAPGPFEGVPAIGGSFVGLDSVFMADVTLWQGNQRVKLAPGRKATLEFVLPDAVANKIQSGQTIPAWWLDVDKGQWQEEGVGTVQPSTIEPGKLAWVANVAHFSWWNADLPWTERHCFIAPLITPEGTPLKNMTVRATGVSYTGVSDVDISHADGNACVDIWRNGTAVIGVGPSSPFLTTVTVTGSGPASDCAGSGAPCVELPPVVVPPAIICEPGQSEDCAYGGPPGTLGVGTCSRSKKMCNAAGTAWSDCVGEVLPQEESCNSPLDEDCDGLVNEGGPGCACLPGETTTCYTGIGGTLDVGVCQGGMRTCDGGFFGACVGQTLPSLETCDTPADDDCNGTNTCTAVVHWAKRFGDVKFQQGRAVAVDATGNVVICGRMQGSLDFGGGPLTTSLPLNWGLFLAKFDSFGNHVWSKLFSGPFDHRCDAVAIDGQGNIFASGYIKDDNLGGGILNGMFVAKFDLNGDHIWSKDDAAGSQNSMLNTMTIDHAGNLVVAGALAGTSDWGGGPLTAQGLQDAIVAKFDPNGGHIWSKQFGDTGKQYVSRLAVDSANNIVLSGQTDGAIEFAPSGWGAGLYTVFVAKLDPNGGKIWGRSFGFVGQPRNVPVAVDGNDNTIVGGTVEYDVPVDTVDFGGEIHTFQYTGGDLFLAKYGPSGNYLWSQLFAQNNGVEGATDVMVGADNSIVVAGAILTGSFDLGGGFQNVPSPTNDIYLVKYDAAGTHVRTKRYVSSGQEDIIQATMDSTGNVSVVGAFTGTLDVGPVPLPSAGDKDVFLVKLAP